MRCDTYLCTRPRLAARLIENGYQCTQTCNPWRPDLNAWIFPRSAELDEIVNSFYLELSGVIPAKVEGNADE